MERAEQDSPCRHTLPHDILDDLDEERIIQNNWVNVTNAL